MKGFDLSWMAWTTPTAIFFLIIFLLLFTLTIWELRYPYRIRSGRLFQSYSITRGDRLFLILLSSAFLHLAWLGLTDRPLYFASILNLPLIYFLALKL